MNRRERVRSRFEEVLEKHGLNRERFSSYVLDQCLAREGLRVIRKVERDVKLRTLIGRGYTDEVRGAVVSTGDVGRNANGEVIEGTGAEVEDCGDDCDCGERDEAESENRD